MNQSPTPDLLSFQKLLEAAWVLQCAREQAAIVDVRGAGTDAAGMGTDLLEPPVALPKLPVATASSADQISVAGSLALAPKREPIGCADFANKPSPFLVAIAHSRRKQQRRPRIRIRLRRGTPVLAIAGMAFALVIAIGFLLQLALRDEVEAARPAPVATTMRKATPASTKVPSHLRITDADIAPDLDALSRYEVKSLRRQAQAGDDYAALMLSMAYETGHATSQNCQEAARWATLAAQAGNRAAQYNLGLRYLYGDGVVANPVEGRKWMDRSARRGYSPAREFEAKR